MLRDNLSLCLKTYYKLDVLEISTSQLNHFRMKKQALSVILIMLCIFASCQSDYMLDESQISVSETVSEDVSFESSMLINNLENFNDSLFQSSNLMITRSLSGWKRRIAIAAADAMGAWQGIQIGMEVGSLLGPKGAAVGAAVGGIVCGAGASFTAEAGTRSSNAVNIADVIAAAAKMKESTSIQTLQSMMPKIVILNIPNDKKPLQIMGPEHNVTLDNLRKKNLTYNEGNAFTREELYVLKDTKFRSAFAVITSGKSYHSPNYKVSNRVMQLYVDALNNSSNSCTDVKVISNRYINEVYTSGELTDSEVDGVISSICVLASSVEYWNDIE